MKKSIILIAFLLLCFSCGKTETEIKGEMFVSTKSGENIKLGAVQINIYKKGNVDSLNATEKGFAKPDYTAQTDADGKFSAKVLPGNYSITARAQRQTPIETERYYWDVDVKAEGSEVKAVFNNNNLELD